MVIDAFREVGGLASTDVTPEGFLYDVNYPSMVEAEFYRLEDTLFFHITSTLMTRWMKHYLNLTIGLLMNESRMFVQRDFGFHIHSRIISVCFQKRTRSFVWME